MSLTQWFTRSSPMVEWRPVRNASLILVPTPSAEETSTGIAKPLQTKASAEAADVGEHARGEGGARHVANRADRAVGFVDIDTRVPVTYSPFVRHVMG